jgi:hypothetical protein
MANIDGEATWKEHEGVQGLTQLMLAGQLAKLLKNLSR